MTLGLDSKWLEQSGRNKAKQLIGAVQSEVLLCGKHLSEQKPLRSRGNVKQNSSRFSWSLNKKLEKQTLRLQDLT